MTSAICTIWKSGKAREQGDRRRENGKAMDNIQ